MHSSYYIAKRTTHQANTIIQLVRLFPVRYNFALMEQLSASITIAALHLNNTFPFHTDPMFEIPSGFVDGMGGIMSAAFAPFVTLDQLDKWSDYSVENQGWIEESAYLQKVHPIHRDAMHGTFHDHEHDRRRRGLQEETLEEKEATEQISPKLFHWENGQKVQETAREMYAPLWQISPANYININNNLLADPRILELYRTMLNRNKGKRDLGVLSSHTKVQELFDFLYDEDQKHMKQTAHAIYMQPVYDKIAENSNMIGFTISLTSFGNFLDYILGKGQSGIVGVLKDNCNNILSFELSDRKTTFLGYADMHDKNFDKYERVEYDLEMYGEYFEGSCSHDLYIYPTQKRKQLYETGT